MLEKKKKKRSQYTDVADVDKEKAQKRKRALRQDV